MNTNHTIINNGESRAPMFRTHLTSTINGATLVQVVGDYSSFDGAVPILWETVVPAGDDASEVAREAIVSAVRRLFAGDQTGQGAKAAGPTP